MKPKRVSKPWGWEYWFAHTPTYLGKVIFIKKGHRLSQQFHRWKHETVYTEKGRWVLEIGRTKRRMKPGDFAEIRPGVIHRFTAPLGNVRLIEVSTAHPNDVVRLSDDYGRSK